MSGSRLAKDTATFVFYMLCLVRFNLFILNSLDFTAEFWCTADSAFNGQRLSVSTNFYQCPPLTRCKVLLSTFKKRLSKALLDQKITIFESLKNEIK